MRAMQNLTKANLASCVLYWIVAWCGKRKRTAATRNTLQLPPTTREERAWTSNAAEASTLACCARTVACPVVSTLAAQLHRQSKHENILNHPTGHVVVPRSRRWWCALRPCVWVIGCGAQHPQNRCNQATPSASAPPPSLNHYLHQVQAAVGAREGVGACNGRGVS